MTAPSTSFLPPGLLEHLGGLEVIAKTVVRGFQAGIHRSPLRGAGEDFAKHRDYQQGDDVRYLDWKLYARTDRLYVREFEERSNLQAELERVKAERDVALREMEMLREQVGALQGQNTMLVARLGREGGGFSLESTGKKVA